MVDEKIITKNNIDELINKLMDYKEIFRLMDELQTKFDKVMGSRENTKHLRECENEQVIEVEIKRKRGRPRKNSN